MTCGFRGARERFRARPVSCTERRRETIMALFTHTAGRTREPLGGTAADGFGTWLELSAVQATEAAAELRKRLPLDNAGRYVAINADRHYAEWLRRWRLLRAGKSESVIPKFARDDFEVKLIAGVMGSLGALRFARESGRFTGEWDGRGRPMMDIEAEYNRAVMLLANYVGCTESMVRACGEDQEKLSALRAV